MVRMHETGSGSGSVSGSSSVNGGEQVPCAVLNETPLTELSANTRKQLACMLNRKKVLHSEEGYERDWRGIAYLAQQLSYVNEFANNPTELVITSWCKYNYQTANFGNLQKYLGIIDRWDVCDDIQENLIKDAQRYILKQQQQLTQARESPSPLRVETNNNQLGRPFNILTEDDEICLQKGQPLPKYNACVLYAEADIERATEIMRNLESPRYNLKLFLRHRDLQLGVPFELVELSTFMATRCSHLIVVLTEELFQSPETTYLLNYTQKLQIEMGERKIIPIVYNATTKVPPTLSIYSKINYAASSPLFNFWDKLAGSLHDVDAKSLYIPPVLQNDAIPSANSEPIVQPSSLPETPRILLNDTDVTDMPDCKLPEVIHPIVEAVTSTPLPEAKPKKKNKFLRKITNFGTVPRSGTTKPLRHAYSISNFNVTERDRTLSASSSNVSTTSESKKSSIIWRPLIKRVFSRSSAKLTVPS